MDSRPSIAAPLFAGLAVIAAGALVATPREAPLKDASRRWIRPAEHIQFRGGVAIVTLSGPWDTFAEDVRHLKRLPDLKRIVIDITGAREREPSVREGHVPELQREFPKCEFFIWTGEY